MIDNYYHRTILPFIILICICVASASSQSILKGRVVDELTEEPLPYASVYFNSTTNGVTTGLDGDFEIRVDSNYLELVISFLGYKPILYKLKYTEIDRPFLFQLAPLSQEIEEIKIKGKRGQRWYDNLAHFTRMFIGESSIAKKTKIKNPEVLSFTYDEAERLFQAKARGPIYITNELLGYDLEYALDHFSHDYKSNKVVFLGYPRYTEKKGRKGKMKRWDKRRNEAYLGSSTHFMKAMYDGAVEEEGFRINEIVRSPNTNRPSDDELERAKALAREIGYNSNLPDSIRNVLKRGREPKHIDYLDKNPHPYEEDISRSETYVTLSFSNIRQVIYDKEVEDKYYTPPGALFNRDRIAGPQTSTIEMTADSVEMLPNGLLRDPLAVLFQGYWAFEKVADMLPLDYEPTVDE